MSVSTTARTKRNDAMPHVSRAGLTAAAAFESTTQCLNYNLDPRNQRPATPTEIKRFRKSYQDQVGVGFIHTGLVNQPLPPPHHRHGVTTTKGDHVGDTFQQLPSSELTQYLNDQKEASYYSNVREPLGRGYNRGHVLPEETKTNEFDGFGKKSASSENAKNLIYFDEPIPDKRVISQNSTRALAPSNYHTNERDITRQLNREYNWEKAGIDPNTHRFGKVEPFEPAGVASSLTFPDETKLCDQRVEQVKGAQNGYLGKSREVRGALRGLGDEFAFGKVNAPDEWGAKKTIMGSYTPQEQMPDKDLGISTRKLNKLETVPTGVDMGGARVYGLPSLRGDLVAPKQISVADPNNYGNEMNAKGLLYPAKYAFDGIAESDFLLVRPEGEVRELFRRMGQEFDDVTFNTVCEVAKRDFGALSADSFRHALNKCRFEEEEKNLGEKAIPQSTLESNSLILSAVNFN